MTRRLWLLLCIFLLPAMTSSTSTSTSSSMTSSTSSPTTTSSTTSGSVTSTPEATTEAPSPSSLQKPETNGPHASVFSIRTFDFSKKKTTTTPAPVDTCFSNDMCNSMPGICNKGQCMTKKCTLDIVCLCEPGITGQFCDRNISDVKARMSKDVKIVNGKIVSTTPVATTTSNGKTHVNGHVDPNLINSVEEKKASGSYKPGDPPEDSKTTITASKTTTVQTPARSEPTNATTTASVSTEPGTKGITKNKREGQHRGATTKIKPTFVSTAKNNHVTTTTGPEVKVLKTTTIPTTAVTPTREVYPDGSYKKGPEAIVMSDNSPLMVNPSDQEVRTSAPSVIEQKTDVLKISTTTVVQNRVSMIPNGPRSTTKSNVGVKTQSNRNNTSNKDKKNHNNSNNKSTPETKSATKKLNVPSNVVGVQHVKEGPTTDGPSKIINIDIPLPSNSNGNSGPSDASLTGHIVDVNPVTDTIEKAKSVLLAQKSGSVDITNDLVTGHALFENKEITITIEKTKDSVKQASNEGKGNSERPKDKTAPKTKSTGSNFKKFAVGPDTVKHMLKDINRQISPNTGSSKDHITQNANGGNSQHSVPITTAAPSKTDALNFDKMDSLPSSSNTEKNATSTTTMELNPLLQLLNMIGSREFVDHVSAVKIEIITKPNSNNNSSEKQTNILSASTATNQKQEAKSVELPDVKSETKDSSATAP